MNAPVPSSEFARKLAHALQSYPAEERYLVGVSGGRDSVALLHGLLNAGFKRLVVCHLDHGLRGEAAAEDARFVQRLAETLKLQLDSGRADVPMAARETKQSLETAARAARYAFFAKMAGRRRCHSIFLAHHADDQVETFLFNLLRGAGPAGLGGMAVESVQTLGRRKLRILRPLLGIWRTEIDGYLETHHLEWREDTTNADPAHATRNRFRAEVVPLLERAMGRAVRPALWRAADILQAEEAWITSMVGEAQPPARLPVAILASQPVAVQRRTVRSWLLARGIGGIGYVEIERVRELLDFANGPSKVNLPGGCHARRRAGALFIETPSHPSRQKSPPAETVPGSSLG